MQRKVQDAARARQSEHPAPAGRLRARARARRRPPAPLTTVGDRSPAIRNGDDRLPHAPATTLLVSSSTPAAAGARIAGVHPPPEPLDALRRRAVREAIGHHAAGGHLLQPVVADRRGGAQRLLHVARIELDLPGRGAAGLRRRRGPRLPQSSRPAVRARPRRCSRPVRRSPDARSFNPSRFWT